MEGKAMILIMNGGNYTMRESRCRREALMILMAKTLRIGDVLTVA